MKKKTTHPDLWTRAIHLLQNEPRRSAETPHSLNDLKDMSNKNRQAQGGKSTSQTGANSPQGNNRSPLSCPINRVGPGAQGALRVVSGGGRKTLVAASQSLPDVPKRRLDFSGTGRWVQTAEHHPFTVWHTQSWCFKTKRGDNPSLLAVCVRLERVRGADDTIASVRGAPCSSRTLGNIHPACQHNK